MKINIPAVTLCVLLSSDITLSHAERVGIVVDATEMETNKEVETKKEEVKVQDYGWNDRSKRLREKLKVMADLRMKLWTREGYHLVKSKKECSPHGGVAEYKNDSMDIGILGCGSSGDICIQDSSSSLGGICALVAGGEGDEDGTVIREYGDQKLSSRPGNMSSMLKPLTANGQLKAKSIFESALDGYTSLIGEDCDPGTNEGYIEVGSSNPCTKSGHVCVNDATSKLGGTCVDIGHDGHFLTIESEWKSDGVGCSLNGKPGVKCNGENACLGSDKSKIACGSCNAWGACQYLSNESSIGQYSCNGLKACSYRGPLQSVNATSATLTVGTNSCNYVGACNRLLGDATIGNDSCCAPYACNGLRDLCTKRDPNTCDQLKGTIEILNGSCNKDGACSMLSGNTRIGIKSCNHCYSCSSSSGVTNVWYNSCNSAFACSNNIGSSTIKSNSCNSANACMHLSVTSTVGDSSCLGGGSCSYSESLFVGDGSCQGLNACSRLISSKIANDSCLGVGACLMSGKELPANAALEVGDKSCVGCYACTNVMGRVVITQGSCYGGSSCRDLVGDVRVGWNSCRGFKACSKNVEAGTVRIGKGSCNDIQACAALAGSATVPEFECNSGFRPCKGCSGTCGAYDESSTLMMRSGARAQLRGSENTDNNYTEFSSELEGAGCFPYAQKLKLQRASVIESEEGFEFELRVTSSGVNVAEGKHSPVDMGRDAWEVDLQDSFPVSSASVLNTWCNKSEDIEKCLCNLSGATLSLIDGSGKEVISVSAGDTCGQELLEFVFDASSEFCTPIPVPSPSRWRRRRAFDAAGAQRAKPSKNCVDAMIAPQPSMSAQD